jgi:hypothetical protein
VTDIERVSAKDLTEAQEAELAASAVADLGDDAPTLPLLSVTQQLSKAVTERGIPSGHFLNTLTDKDYGDAVELVVVYATKGRFYSNRDTGDVFVAFGEVAPDNWPDEYAGRRFDELPDAEETYKERANSGEIPWGSGPPIRTTKNFVGFIPDDPEIPVRLSLMRTSAPAAQKIEALIKWSFKAPWHNVIELRTKQESDKQDRPYFVVRASQGRETDAAERGTAVNLHQVIQGALGSLRLTGEGDERKSAPKSDPDALDVG